MNDSRQDRLTIVEGIFNAEYNNFVMLKCHIPHGFTPEPMAVLTSIESSQKPAMSTFLPRNYESDFDVMAQASNATVGEEEIAFPKPPPRGMFSLVKVGGKNVPC